jgi:hypothetical protein
MFDVPSHDLTRSKFWYYMIESVMEKASCSGLSTDDLSHPHSHGWTVGRSLSHA